MSKVYSRKNKTLNVEQQYKAGILNFLYEIALGRVLLKIIILPTVSKLGGWYSRSKWSARRIPVWIAKYKIDMSQYEEVNYENFNDFFIRKKKSSNDNYSLDDFIAPAESKLKVYRIEDDMTLNIKNSTYTLKELFQTEEGLDAYRNGYCLVFYLTVDCYHRYCFVDSGQVLWEKDIKGKLHTVSSISKEYKIFKENHRKYSVLKTDYFGEMIMMEVGALMVGKIKNHPIKSFHKGQEKGYFELGGSTIILFVKDKSVIVDEDILKHSALDIAVEVAYQERIGRRYV